MEHNELLLKEYEIVSSQLIHWDSHFWHKSQFFLAIESVFLAVVFQRLSTEFTDVLPMNLSLFFMLIAIALFNIFICYVWFRTNRSNQEYLIVRFIRGMQIEDELEPKGTLNLFHLQAQTLSERKYNKHSSSRWEAHLPSAFIWAWIMCFAASSLDSDNYLPIIIAGIATFLILGLIFVIEKTGWPNPIRERFIIASKQSTEAVPESDPHK